MLYLLAFLQAASTVSTPTASTDTVGYRQQQADYRIVAHLDEGARELRARGTLTYRNASRDTLRELRFHQHLNAFRPGSRWSADDEREGRVRFQKLGPEDIGYERFTAAPSVDGQPLPFRYPHAPDSTVVHVTLPRPLAPGQTVRMELAWVARPSTVPRRQGRRGRMYDFAHWYPRIAVYDRGGWQDNPLRAAGEFYGEFGTFDVSLVVRDDQVIGGTGVPVSGDPGWARVARNGRAPRVGADAYGDLPAAPSVEAPAGHRVVRWVARGVHHFAWSTSPDFLYEGGTWVRPAASDTPVPFRTWDTVSVHVLYRPGDERDWGSGLVVERTRNSLRWLERFFGPYAYPQMTVLHRLDGGGTEFPMMQANGSASQGLNLHEGGHIYAHGILANNEWRSGWMDEGLTSYQTAWAQGLTPQENGRPAAPGVPAIRFPAPEGYRARAHRPSPLQGGAIEQIRLDLAGRTEPIGTVSHEFREFGVYNSMIYTRAERMYSALRDVLGDSAFAATWRDYYARWGLRHVDEAAMRGSAERVSGRDLRWFFDQWVHRVGLVDYELRRVHTRREGSGWVTEAQVLKRGEYFHPIPVGVRTDAGWTIAHAGDPLSPSQTVVIRTAEEPRDVQLDPLWTSGDWNRGNDFRPVRLGPLVIGRRGEGQKVTRFGWPFLDQYDARKRVSLLRPTGWWSEGSGAVLGIDFHDNYQGRTWRSDGLLAWSLRDPAAFRGNDVPSLVARFPEAERVTSPDGDPIFARLSLWADARWTGKGRYPEPAFRFATGVLDGVGHSAVSYTRTLSPFVLAPTGRTEGTLALSAVHPFAWTLLDERRWSGLSTYELSAGLTTRSAPARRAAARISAAFGARGNAAPADFRHRFYGRVEAEATRARRWGTRSETLVRGFFGWTENAPRERSVWLSAQSPVEAVGNHWWRPREGILSSPDVPFIPLGGAGLRGYSPFVPIGRVLAANVEHDLLLKSFGAVARPMQLSASLFADAALPIRGTVLAGGTEGLAGAGVGLVARGHVYDRELRLRLDLPLWLSTPSLAAGRLGKGEEVAFRWTFSFSDPW